MKTFFKIILSFVILISFLSINSGAVYAEDNLELNIKKTGKHVENNSKLEYFKNNLNPVVENGGERGIALFLSGIGKDIKNFFISLAVLYLLFITIRIFFATDSEEELGKFKNGIIWTTIGIMVMQMTFTFTEVLYVNGDGYFDGTLGKRFLNQIIFPLFELLAYVTSFLFIAMAIYAFYRMVTAGGDEDKAKKGKVTIINAIIGFIVIKFASLLVKNTYGVIKCGNTGIGNDCIGQPRYAENIQIIVDIINWINTFIGILVVLMIIYAGYLILFGFGDEEKTKKAKNIIIYVIVGMFIITASFLIMTFFIIPETKIG